MMTLPKLGVAPVPLTLIGLPTVAPSRGAVTLSGGNNTFAVAVAADPLVAPPTVCVIVRS